MDISAPLAVLLGLLGLAGLIGAALPYLRSQNTKATIELQAAELKAEREARQSQSERYDTRIAEMERRHAAQVGELRGRIESLQVQYAKAIASDVATEVIRLVRKELLGG